MLKVNPKTRAKLINFTEQSYASTELTWALRDGIQKFTLTPTKFSSQPLVSQGVNDIGRIMALNHLRRYVNFRFAQRYDIQNIIV